MARNFAALATIVVHMLAPGKADPCPSVKRSWPVSKVDREHLDRYRDKLADRLQLWTPRLLICPWLALFVACYSDLALDIVVDVVAEDIDCASPRNSADPKSP